MKVKKILKISLCIFCVLLIILISGVIYVCQSFNIKLKSGEPQLIYNAVLKSAYESNKEDFGNMPVTKIAMLGSHDALSYNINYSSSPDIAENNVANNSFVRVFAKGITARLAKAQNHDIYTQLMCGVRLIDARITYCYNDYYTSHGVISHRLEDSIKQILQFLYENNGEFIVFCINKYYNGTSNYTELLDYISKIKYNEKNLFDYVNYDTEKVQLESELTYNKLTKNGVSAGALLIDNTSVYMPNTYEKYFRVKGLSSKWHNKIKVDEIVDSIDNHAKNIKNYDIIRINQTQLTSNSERWFDTLIGWSLLNMAEKSNATLIDNINFEYWLHQMPVYLCDYTTCTVNDFNKKVNEKILKYNTQTIYD